MYIIVFATSRDSIDYVKAIFRQHLTSQNITVIMCQCYFVGHVLDLMPSSCFSFKKGIKSQIRLLMFQNTHQRLFRNCLCILSGRTKYGGTLQKVWKTFHLKGSNLLHDRFFSLHKFKILLVTTIALAYAFIRKYLKGQ